MNIKKWFIFFIAVILAAGVFLTYRFYFSEEAKRERSAKLYNLGFQYYNQNALKKAEDSFRKCVSLNKDALSFHIALAEIMYKRGKVEEALKEIPPVSGLSQSYELMLCYFKTRLLLSLGRSDEALRLCRGIMTAYPDDKTSCQILSDTLIRKYYAEAQRTGKKDASLMSEIMATMKKSITLDPQEYYIPLQMGLVSFLENYISLAEKYLSLAEELERKAFGEQALITKDNTLNNPMADHRPEDMNDLINLNLLKGFCALSRGDGKLFNSCLSSALKTINEWPFPLFSQASPRQEFILLAKSAFLGQKLAVEDFKALDSYYRRLDSCEISLPPGEVQSRKLLLEMVQSTEQGDIKGAELRAEEIRKLLLQDPLPTSGCAFQAMRLPLLEVTLDTYLGDAFKEKNQPQEARRCYEKALKIQPWNAVIKNKLAGLKV
ncbi:MAG: tetratricopeptide repeat protein [bacterium]